MTAAPAPFIDAHHHLWEPYTLEYGWLRDIGSPKPFGDPTPIQRDYTKEEFWTEAAACGLIASVHVQADGALPDPVSESRWIAEQAAREPGRGQPGKWVGFVNLLRDDAQAVLEAHAAVPGFAGIRHIVARTETAPSLSFVPTELMQSADWQQNFARLGKWVRASTCSSTPTRSTMPLPHRPPRHHAGCRRSLRRAVLPARSPPKPRRSRRGACAGALGRVRLETLPAAQRVDQGLGSGHVPSGLGCPELPGDLPDHP